MPDPACFRQMKGPETVPAADPAPAGLHQTAEKPKKASLLLSAAFSKNTVTTRTAGSATQVSGSTSVSSIRKILIHISWESSWTVLPIMP